MSGDLRPVVAAVVRHVHAAPPSSAVQVPGVDLDLPQAGEQGAGVLRVDRQVGATGAVVHEQHLLPAPSAIARPEHAPLRLGRVPVAHGAHVDHVGVAGVHDDAPYATRLPQAHVLPRLARVGGQVDTVPEGGGQADVEGFPRAGPYLVVGRGRDGQRPDGLRGLVVEHRPPAGATVLGLPHAAGSRAHVGDQRIPGLAHHRAGPVAVRPELAPPEAVQEARVRGRGYRRQDGREHGVRVLGSGRDRGQGRETADHKERADENELHGSAGRAPERTGARPGTRGEKRHGVVLPVPVGGCGADRWIRTAHLARPAGATQGTAGRRPRPGRPDTPAARSPGR